MDVNVGSFENNHGKIQAISCNYATNQNSIQMAKVNEMPPIQTIRYDFQIFETCQLFLSNLIKSNKIKQYSTIFF